ncbi:putative porin [Aliikangiella sp. IMCC44359]|uniref:putative porin n=1 Tax=Aliikangiella sp. IMCC44359 TaxID=3459125 RepID=UPI00403B250B
MKSKSLLIGLSLLSASVAASDYNLQLDVDYIDLDGGDVVSAQGTYYFDNVSTANTAWAEAAFMGRNNNVSLGYIDVDGDFSILHAAIEFFGDSNNNLYAQLNVVDSDQAGVDRAIGGEIGYFLAENWLVAVGTNDSDDAPIVLRTKYVGELGGGQFFNVEANIDDEEHDLTVMGDYYWTPQSSVGLALSNEDGYDYGVRFQHFFNPAISARFSYESFDSGDAIAIGLVARF